MMTNVVLTLSYMGDSTARRVLEAIKKRQYPFLLMDTADFPSQIQLDTGKCWEGYVTYEGNRYSFTDIQRIYVRRPR